MLRDTYSHFIYNVHQCTVYTHLAKSCPVMSSHCDTVRSPVILTSVDVPCPMH